MTRNSYGNDNRGIRKWIREMGEKPSVALVERLQREVSRSQTENERVVSRHKEAQAQHGTPSTFDAKGDVKARVRRIVQTELANRKRKD